MEVGDLCKICKGLRHPSAQFSPVVVWPYHVIPLFHASFSKRFHFCHYFFSKVLLRIGSHIWDSVHQSLRLAMISRFEYGLLSRNKNCEQLIWAGWVCDKGEG